jgi:ABC-type uncharacterized transport system involved in gliding motility auxiliary subunit
MVSVLLIHFLLYSLSCLYFCSDYDLDKIPAVLNFVRLFLNLLLFLLARLRCATTLFYYKADTFLWGSFRFF